MLRAVSVSARVLAIPLAALAVGWLIFSPPPSGAGKAGLFLVFLVSFAVIAYWFCEAHVLAPTRPKQLVSGLAASAVATGLLAAVLAIPNGSPEAGAAPAATGSTEEAKPVATGSPTPSVHLPTPEISNSVTSPEHPEAKAISPDTAFDFFTERYFPVALEDPHRALQQYGTVNFQHQKERTGVASYTSFYEDTLSIPTDQVRVARDGNSPDTFDVRFLRVLKSGRTAKIATVYGVRCSDAALSDPYGCSSSDLRVDSSATLK